MNTKGKPCSRNEALRIATQALAKNVKEVPLICHGKQPHNCHIYDTPAEPCWFIYVPWNDQKNVLVIRGSRVILIGKLTGTILYDGPAGDEG